MPKKSGNRDDELEKIEAGWGSIANAKSTKGVVNMSERRASNSSLFSLFFMNNSFLSW